MTPKGASSNGTSFSSRACGAWSVAIASIVPSRSASISAARSSSARSGGFIFTFGSSERTASSVRQRWCGVTSAVARTPGLAGAAELGDRLARGEVQQVERPRLVAGEREVARDHDALGHGRVAAEAELGRDEALVHVAAARERRLLAVNRHRPRRRGAVLERAPDQPGRDDRAAVVGEPRGAALGQLDHLGQLGARLAPS